MDAIVVTGLRKSFGRNAVLDGIDLNVDRGTVFALLGANGSGKTTTINILTTLIHTDGRDGERRRVRRVERPSKVHEQISMTGQFAAVDDLFTARENLVLMGELRHVADPRQTAADLLERFDLTDAADRRLLTFSGGIRRRLDIAMSLVGDAPVDLLRRAEDRTRPDGSERQVADDPAAGRPRDDGVLTTQYLEEADQLADDDSDSPRGKIVARHTRRAEGDGAYWVRRTRIRRGRAVARGAAGARRAARASAEPTRSCSSPPRARSPRWRTSSSASRTSGIEPTGFSRQLPTLDDVSSRSSTTRRRKDMQTLTDTWTMTKRSLRHTTRSIDTIITVVLTPIGILLLFVYVFGGALEKQTGSIDYVDFITPGVVIMTVISGIAYAALRLSTDLQRGIISRFRTMPVAPSSVLKWTGALIDAVQPVLLRARDRRWRSSSGSVAADIAALARVRRPTDPLHPGHHVAGHALRLAGTRHRKAPARSATSCCC